MFKQIRINSCEESETYRFETELSTQQILDVLIKIYLEKEKDINPLRCDDYNIFHIIDGAWDWDKLKEHGIFPVKEPDETITLWGWHTLKKYWENDDEVSGKEEKYLIEGIKEGRKKNDY